MQQRIYIDTSVLGGYYDDEFKKDTRLFFQRIENKDYLIHLSEISDFELLPAPERVKDTVNLIPPDCTVKLKFTKEAEDVAETYINEKILGKSSFNDAYRYCNHKQNRHFS